MAYFVVDTILADINKTGNTTIQTKITNEWGPEIDGDIDAAIKPYFSTLPVASPPLSLKKISNAGIKSKYFEFEKLYDSAKHFDEQFDKKLAAFIEGLVQDGSAEQVPEICAKTAGNVTRS